VNDSALSFESLSDRVANLERQNHRLKQFGVLLLLCIAALVAMGQASPIQTIRASHFVVVDEGGRRRAELGINGSFPSLAFYGEKGQAQVLLATNGNGYLALYGGGLHPYAVLEAFQAGSSLSLFSPEDRRKLEQGLEMGLGNTPSISLHADDLGGKVSISDGKSISVGLSGSDPSIFVEDRQGYTTAIGSSNWMTPLTGEKRKTSAASVVLSDKKGNSIWRAP
jgi:hypothetical protein